LYGAAYELNVPATAEFATNPETGTSGGTSLCEVEGTGVIVECVKAPENRAEKTLTLRLYESLGGQSRTTLRFFRELRAAAQTDMLEEHPQTLVIRDKDLCLEFKPFEIKTIRVSF
jgi:alpha-mannosidase